MATTVLPSTPAVCEPTAPPRRPRRPHAAGSAPSVPHPVCNRCTHHTERYHRPAAPTRTLRVARVALLCRPRHAAAPLTYCCHAAHASCQLDVAPAPHTTPSAASNLPPPRAPGPQHALRRSVVLVALSAGRCASFMMPHRRLATARGADAWLRAAYANRCRCVVCMHKGSLVARVKKP